MEAFQTFAGTNVFLSVIFVLVPIIRFSLEMVLAMLGIRCMLKYLKNN
ncbi:hypothetical protein [Anaerotignum sp.]